MEKVSATPLSGAGGKFIINGCDRMAVLRTVEVFQMSDFLNELFYESVLRWADPELRKRLESLKKQFDTAASEPEPTERDLQPIVIVESEASWVSWDDLTGGVVADDGGGAGQGQPPAGGKALADDSGQPPSDKKRGDPPPAQPPRDNASRVAECSCDIKAVPVIHPDPKLDEKERASAKSRYRKAHGSNVWTMVVTRRDMFNDKAWAWTASGHETIQVVHTNPCDSCKGQAVFHLYANAEVEADATIMPSFWSIGSSSAEAEAGIVVAGDLSFTLAVEAMPESTVTDTNTEVEIDVPVSGGGSVKIKFKPKFETGDAAHDQKSEDKFGRKVGDGAEVRISATAFAKGASPGRAATISMARGSTDFAWLGYCDCLRHKDGRLLRRGYVGDSVVKGNDLIDKLRTKALGENPVRDDTPEAPVIIMKSYSLEHCDWTPLLPIDGKDHKWRISLPATGFPGGAQVEIKVDDQDQPPMKEGDPPRDLSGKRCKVHLKGNPGDKTHINVTVYF
jgi:hypothetical protein